MSTHRYIDRLCAAAAVFALLLTMLLSHAGTTGVRAAGRTMGYEDRLFTTDRVHTIDIIIEDWDGFIRTCSTEQYSPCSVVIDGEAFKNVGIRGKGNTSLSSVASMNSERYSFKVEFDQYDGGKSYYGLDKLSLNNLIQDNTLMKDYLSYRLMAAAGAAAPLCSYVWITVNGEAWGLYLAVEAVEESFLLRNYGSNYGELYKPDSMGMGGGRGNGMEFDMEQFRQQEQTGSARMQDTRTTDREPFGQNGFGGIGGFGGMGSAQTKLQYIDDDPDSYSTIFESAKTQVTSADQKRLIQSLKTLSGGGDVSRVVAVEEVIAYFAAHNFVCNGDSYTGSMIHNYYLYEQDGRLSMLPWDYNLAFGAFDQGSSATDTVNTPIDTPVSGGIGEDRPMVRWIFTDAEYMAQYHQVLYELLEQVDFSVVIDETAALLDSYVSQDPTAFVTYEQFRTGVATLREFCLLREQSVLAQLEGTVPSTAQGQREDPSGRIDASHIALSDMGSMGGVRGGPQPGISTDGPGQMGEMAFGQNPGRQPSVTGQGAGFEGFQPWSGEMPFGQGAFPAGQQPGKTESSGDMFPQISEGFGGQRPQGTGSFPGQAGGQVIDSRPLLLGVSVLVLLLGIVVAFAFKRR